MVINEKGLSLLEIIIAISLISIGVLGFSQVFGVGSMDIYKNQQEVIAANLAVGLMSEIMSKPFCDPAACTATLAPEGESRNNCNNNTFDDVDDYQNYTDGSLTNGPRDIRGCEMPEFKGVIRSVNISYVDQGMNVSAGATDFKRVQLTVSSPNTRSVSITEVAVNVTQ